MKNSDIHLVELVLAGAAGILTGICIGLMIAPRSGPDLRRQISEQGRRLEEQMRDATENMAERVRHAVEEAVKRHMPGEIEHLDDLDKTDGGELVRDLERLPRR